MKENLLVMISISSSNKDKLKDISNKISKLNKDAFVTNLFVIIKIRK